MKQLNGGNSGAILSNLYRKIMMDLGISTSVFNRLLDIYVMTQQDKWKSLKDRTTLKSGISTQLKANNMSWKTFVKGIVLLKIPMFKITITLYHTSNEITIHEKEIILDESEAIRIKQRIQRDSSIQQQLETMRK